MSENKWRISTISSNGLVCSLELPGYLGFQHGPQLQDLCIAEPTEQARYVILDMSNLSAMDASAASLLVVLQAKAKAQGHRVMAFGLSETILRVFQQTHLQDVIEIYESENRILDIVRANLMSQSLTVGERTVLPFEEQHSGLWAKPVEVLHSPAVPLQAVDLNTEGRKPTSPVHGFGQLWRKTYQIHLTGVAVSPQHVVAIWKQRFGSFWPKGNHYFGVDEEIKAGQTAVLNLAGPGGLTAPGGKPLIATGIWVVYADEISFAFMTAQGHMYAGMIIFSSYGEDFETVAQVQALIRTGDPLYELGSRLGVVPLIEDRFWHATLKNLAANFNVVSTAKQQNELIDSRVQWSRAGDFWYNAAMRTGIYLLASPFRWIKSRISKS